MKTQEQKLDDKFKKESEKQNKWMLASRKYHAKEALNHLLEIYLGGIDTTENSEKLNDTIRFLTAFSK